MEFLCTHIVGSLDDINEVVGEGTNGPVQQSIEGSVVSSVESLNPCPNGFQLMYNALVCVFKAFTVRESTVILGRKNWDDSPFL